MSDIEPRSCCAGSKGFRGERPHLGSVCRKVLFRADCARGKTYLRERLVRRGLAIPVIAFTSAFAHEARAASIPHALFGSTIRVAIMIVFDRSRCDVVSSSVITLTEGVLKTMLISKLKTGFIGLLVVAVATAGAVVVAQDRPSEGDRLTTLDAKLTGSSKSSVDRRDGVNYSSNTQFAPNATLPTPTAPAAAPAALAAVPQPPQSPAPQNAVLPPPALAVRPRSASPAPRLESQAPPVNASPTASPRHADTLVGAELTR